MLVFLCMYVCMRACMYVIQYAASRAKYSFEDAPYFVHLRMHTGKFFSGDGLLLVFEIAILCL